MRTMKRKGKSEVPKRCLLRCVFSHLNDNSDILISLDTRVHLHMATACYSKEMSHESCQIFIDACKNKTIPAISVGDKLDKNAMQILDTCTRGHCEVFSGANESHFIYDVILEFRRPLNIQTVFSESNSIEKLTCHKKLYSLVLRKRDDHTNLASVFNKNGELNKLKLLLHVNTAEIDRNIVEMIIFKGNLENDQWKDYPYKETDRKKMNNLFVVYSGNDVKSTNNISVQHLLTMNNDCMTLPMLRTDIPLEISENQHDIIERCLHAKPVRNGAVRCKQDKHKHCNIFKYVPFWPITNAILNQLSLSLGHKDALDTCFEENINALSSENKSKRYHGMKWFIEKIECHMEHMFYCYLFVADSLQNNLKDLKSNLRSSVKKQRRTRCLINNSISITPFYIAKNKNIYLNGSTCVTEAEMIKQLRNGLLFFILCVSTGYSLIYMIPNGSHMNTISKRFIVCILNVILVTISSNHLYNGDNINTKDERFGKHLTKYDLFETLDALPFGDNNEKSKRFEKQLKYALFEARDVLQHGKVKSVKELLYDIINYDGFKCSEDIHVYPVVRGEVTNELVRVGTLSAFPDGDSPSLIRLAESGFYYDGKGRELKCFSCGITNNVWSSTTIPLHIHRQLSPNCPYLNERFPLLATKTTDQHIPSIAATTTEQNNIESDSSTNRGICTDSNSHVPALLTSSSSVPVTVTNGPGSVLSDSPSVGSTGYNTRRSYNTSLVTSSTGFSRSNGYSIGYGSQGSNSNSSGYGSQGSSSHSSSYGSQGSSSNSSGYGSQGSNGYSSDSVATGQTSSTNGTSGSQLPALAETDERQLPEGGSFRDSNIQPSSNRNVPKMKYPEYKTKEKRLDTYKNWPKHLTFLYPRDLTECGFFYSNFGDCVRCFHCGIGLRNWEHDDNPWVEHARWSRKCPYLLQRKGQEFVDSVLSVLGLQTDAEIAEQQSNNSSDKSAAISSGNVTGPSAANDVRDPITHPAAQYVIQEHIFGTNVERLVKKAMNQLIQAHDWENINNDMLVNAMLAYNDGTEFMETRSTIDAGTPIQPNATTNMAAQSTPMTTQANGISSSASSVETDPEKVQKENEELKDLYTCKICLDERVGITFVPCGHLVTCRNCSPKIRRCPLCRTFIRGTIKTAV